MIAIFGFVFFTTRQIAIQRAEQQAQQIVDELLETTSLKFYVTQCTEKALEDGIDILSKQGGRIFPNQPGSIMTYSEKAYLHKDDINDKTYQVSYGILKGEIPTPQYPCRIGFENYDDFAFCAYTSTSKFNNLDIGIPNLPRLCKNQFGGCSLKEGWSPAFSVQAELEAYVSYVVAECVDFESIIEVSASYVIKEGNATTNITFSDTDVTALVNFPIVVTPPESQPVLKIVSFTISIPTKFKQLYGFARDSVVNDVSSKTAKTFNIITDFSELLRTKFGTSETSFFVEKKNNLIFYDDFFRFTDASAPTESPLSIQFMVENRPPVLEYIYPPVPKTGCNVYDMIQLQDSIMSFPIKAFDPDGDEITFKYGGWLAEYNETVKNQVIDTNTNCVISSSAEKKYYTLPEQTRLVEAADFETSGKVSAMVTLDDIGPHIMNITVCDQQYCDYQLIRVLIDDLMRIAVEPSNIYGNKIFSVEDPFMFTATIEDIYNPVDYAFAWEIQDLYENILYRNEDGNKELNIPFGEYDITTIKSAYPASGLSFQAGSLYRIIADVMQGGTISVQNETKLYARACVPYKSNDPVYPYSKFDPFFANHTCCDITAGDQSTIRLSSATKICHDKTTYGSYNSFNPLKYRTDYDTANGISPPSPTYTNFDGNILGTESLTLLDSNAANDIFKRIFTRKCSSTRGNMCTGVMTETYYVQQQCADLTETTVARCSGPSLTLDLLSPNSEIETQTSCTNYLGTTFENETGRKTDIVCSKDPKCVSNNNNDDGFSYTTGELRYLCNATCGGNYGCAKTLPDLCSDCYQEQACERTGTSQSMPELKQTTTYQEYTGCSVSSCTVSEPTEKDDFCSGDILNEYLCDAQPYEKTKPYTIKTTDCLLYNERPASETDNGIDYGNSATCFYYDRSLNECTGGKCVYAVDRTVVSDGTVQNPNNPSAIENRYVYREWYVGNGVPPGNPAIQESCLADYQDYDLLINYVGASVAENLCETASLFAGHWDSDAISQRRCCGDDTNEMWDGTNCIST